MDALKELKALERLEDMDDPFAAASADQTGNDANKLLAVSMETDADTASTHAGAPKGNRIIRFTFADDNPSVFANSALSVDLNADGDLNDVKELQRYTLIGDTSQDFAIMPRMEAHVNPQASPSSGRLVDITWKNPTNSRQVNDTTYVQDQAIWSQNIKFENGVGTNLPGGVHTKSAQFRGIRAIGGLIQLSIPEMFTAGIGASGVAPAIIPGTANNDYELLVNLRCRKWVPLA